MTELFDPKIEEEILEFWRTDQTFEKSLKKRQKSKKFIFFEGPPSANGRPGIHHVLTRVYKDIICRYKTMAGFRVDRKAGWDTHGLPVELQAEKELGIKHKADIEKYGVARFNRRAREITWNYKKEWDELTRRVGFWLDLDNPYITYEPYYIESLWSLISKIASKNLLYQDFKVVPYCPRCGTALSSHEVALGYKKVEEDSVYVKFKLTDSENTFILSWTTTPWTLPGNVALAVGRNIKYDFVKIGQEVLILAQNLKKNVLSEAGEVIKTVSGKALIGLEYEPLFEVKKLKTSTSYKIYDADFVSTEDGTGVVHTAVMYGEDDFNLGKKISLPKFHTVDLEGKFIKGLGLGLDGLFVKSGEAQSKILKILKEKNLLLKTLKYEHDYPFCWRCSTPLLYYAKTSWFIKIEKLRAKLIANNKKINWVPANVKTGRFGGWLNEAKDWAISRERYWGTPLPVWRCAKCAKEEIIGSLHDLDKLSVRKPNYYIFLCHGQAENNKVRLLSFWPEKRQYPLTVQGIKEIKNLIPWFKKKKIDLIFSSDLLRTKESAEIMARALGKKVIFDKRLREYDFGIYNGERIEEWHALFGHKRDQYIVKTPERENLGDVKKRIMDFLKSLDAKYEDKIILIVSHGNPILAASVAYQGYGDKEAFEIGKKFSMEGVAGTGNTIEMSGHNWPYNDDGDMDLHRPFVDKISLGCPKCSGKMKRVKEVMDVWFDSGAMPFAQWHWPFEKKLEYPADFISEGVDQTRGWFYTLLAVGTLLGKGPAYKNVISLGHILDERGEKMSKSRGNVVDPWQIINKYGIDALRWYFYTVNPPGEPKNFNEKDIAVVLRNFVLTLWNVANFYKTYVDKKSAISAKLSDFSSLDRWIFSRLHNTIKQIRQELDKYEVTQAARLAGDLVDDLSRWWLRRSRRRFQRPRDKKELDVATFVLENVLENIAKILAPFTPFLSEALSQELGKKESIHLADWPKVNPKFISVELESAMQEIRRLAALGLAQRSQAGIKVRQPLSFAAIKQDFSKGLLDLLSEELNVKEIKKDKNLKEDIILDTHLTAELTEEGQVREFIRQIQDMRRDASFKPQDKIEIYLKAPENIKEVFERWRDLITQGTASRRLDFYLTENVKTDIKKTVELENQEITAALKKVR